MRRSHRSRRRQNGAQRLLSGPQHHHGGQQRPKNRRQPRKERLGQRPQDQLRDLPQAQRLLEVPHPQLKGLLSGPQHKGLLSGPQRKGLLSGLQRKELQLLHGGQRQLLDLQLRCEHSDQPDQHPQQVNQNQRPQHPLLFVRLLSFSFLNIFN